MALRQPKHVRASGSASPATPSARLNDAGQQLSSTFAGFPDVSASFTLVEETRMLSVELTGDVTTFHRELVDSLASLHDLSVDWQGDEATLTG